MFNHVRRHGRHILGLVLGGKGIDPDGPVPPKLRGKGLGRVDFLDLETKSVHFGTFGLDQCPVGVPLLLLGKDCLIGGLDAVLKFLVLLRIQGPEIVCALEHHVFEHMGNPGFSSILEGGAGTNGEPAGNLRRGIPFDHQKLHAVVEPKFLDLQIEAMERLGRPAKPRGGDQQDKRHEERFAKTHNGPFHG